MGIQYLSAPMGILRLESNGQGLISVVPVMQAGEDRPDAVTAQAAQQLQEYFSRRRQKFQLPLCLTGTDFQRRIWQELLKLPYGQAVTYGALAAKIGSPRACRSVGAALGKNPLLIVVPCHRVLASKGIGGFSAGPCWKRQLLALEGIFPEKS